MKLESFVDVLSSDPKGDYKLAISNKGDSGDLLTGGWTSPKGKICGRDAKKFDLDFENENLDSLRNKLKSHFSPHSKIVLIDEVKRKILTNISDDGHFQWLADAFCLTQTYQMELIQEVNKLISAVESMFNPFKEHMLDHRSSCSIL